MAKTYAWSNFPVERNEWGQVTKTISVGEEVTADMLGVSKEEFDELINLGAVSEQPYPKIPANQSPTEYVADQEARGARGELSDGELKALQAYKESLVDQEEAAAIEAANSGGGKAASTSTNK